MFNRYLLITNVGTCSVMLGLGEVMIQQIEMYRNHREKRDWKKVGKFLHEKARF